MFPEAVIFDLDGTLIDNNAYHIEAWRAFYDKIGKPFSKAEYTKNINGRINRDIFNYVFNTTLKPELIDEYTTEKEAMYRDLYQPHIKPINGLIELLDELEREKIPKAIATSGLVPNINFMFEHVPVKKYFAGVIDASQVANGKPHPEIFLKAANSVKTKPQNCVAFEDSIAGIRSAKAAGMKVVALTTTHTSEELKDADLIIKDYTDISLTQLRKLKAI